MVLLMRGEDQRIQYLTAGDGGVVAQIGIDEAGPVFQLRVRSHYKTNGFYAIEYTASISYDAIHQLASFPDLRLGFGGGVDGDVLYFVGSFQIGVAAYPYVLDDLAILDNCTVPDLTVISSSVIEDLFCELLELILQGLIVAEAAP